ncbi:MAG TPA: patatin-like phospholipase family protein [Gemmatirosa sp.]
MPFSVSVLSVSPAIEPAITAAVEQLNEVQNVFQFSGPPEEFRRGIHLWHHSSYEAREVFARMREFRERARAGRRYVICAVDGRLAIDEVGARNAFGALDEGKELAVFTLYGQNAYVTDPVRYAAYFLTRYALSFLPPGISLHPRGSPPAGCFFDNKDRRPAIRESLRRASICESCRDRMRDEITVEVNDALTAMSDVVSGRFPLALVMKGGGVKGLAHAAAFQLLSEHYRFDTFVGTSAGAIAAVLFAARYSGDEVAQLLSVKDFQDFLDGGSLGRQAVRLVLHGGCHPGDVFQDWVDDLLRARIQREGEISMADLAPQRAIIYSASSGRGTVIFDSAGVRSDESAAFATRCSMSIPFLFVPPRVGGVRAYDGGMRNNFPLRRFLEDNPRKPLIGLYLSTDTHRNRRRWLPAELIDIWTDGDEAEQVDQRPESVAVIDPYPVRTTDFALTAEEKRYLETIGRASAMLLVRRRLCDGGPSLSDIKAVLGEARGLYDYVCRRRGVPADGATWFLARGH